MAKKQEAKRGRQWLPGLSPAILKNYREANGMTKVTLASTIRKQARTYATWENGGRVPSRAIQKQLLKLIGGGSEALPPPAAPRGSRDVKSLLAMAIVEKDWELVRKAYKALL